VVEDACKRLVATFDGIVPSFYDPGDRERGEIRSTDREGNPRTFPLMAISIAVVFNLDGRLTHYGEASQTAMALKKKAKENPRSCYVLDRRRGENSPSGSCANGDPDGPGPLPEPGSRFLDYLSGRRAIPPRRSRLRRGRGPVRGASGPAGPEPGRTGPGDREHVRGFLAELHRQRPGQGLHGPQALQPAGAVRFLQQKKLVAQSPLAG
jgi:hypothetical protein